MNIACISHYSPLYKNKSNAWMLDFYSSAYTFTDIENIYFFHVSFRNQSKIMITKMQLNKKMTDVSIILPLKYKFFRLFNITDKKFISIINREIKEFLTVNKIHLEIVHVNTLYYAFFVESFKEYSNTCKFFLHLHENKYLLNKVLNKSKYSSVNYIDKYDYIIRQTPTEIENVKKYNRNMIFLPNAFDESFFNYADKDNNETICILSIGYLRKTKNYILALDVIKFLISKGYDVKYNIIGSGPELKKLVKYTKKNNIQDAVIFHGFQNKEEIQKSLIKSDLLLNTSYYESFGNVLLEALTTGTPVVTCAEGGPEYLFKWSSNNIYLGEYVSANVDKISEAIIKVIEDKDKNRITGMKKTSQTVRQRFSSKRFLSDLINIRQNGYKVVKEWWKYE
ncbi:glycosyltransferase family 4 protein [Mesobacillus sp. AQ2]|uniref:glycosyltransferase family 4 protein n=1 Tax=Mesobacillus sp. AQ2 TaxID=3043332 RepID=UPI0024C1E9C0|nr:glycosyltransferase family 4 protein [Mesobacillus sp. AQ2]WHX40384.1 glycosyltransferase family 4 protein [Mesobacillus sp. AQ2]